jgi:hypothetical protein
MTILKHSFIRLLFLISLIWVSEYAYAQTSATEIWNNGISLQEQALAECSYVKYIDGLKLMEKAFKYSNKRGDWCYCLGQAYSNAIFIDDDYGEAHTITIDENKGIEWFKKGAELGDLKSALYLYKKYKPSTELNIFNKKEWNEYIKLRDIRWKYAGIALHLTVPEDFNDYITLADAALETNNDELAYKYLAMAVDNNEPNAIELAINHEPSLDFLTSKEVIYKTAAAIWQRNKLYDKSIQHDKALGLKLFEKSARMGYPVAQAQMGYNYLSGLAGATDTLKAVSWYKLAAQNKLPEAMYKLGVLYANNTSIGYDDKEAFDLLKESADSCFLPSQLALGYCYLYGIGTQPNYVNARMTFQSLFDIHGQGNHIIRFDNRIIELYYLLGLTYYKENSREAIALFESSLKTNVLPESQRADILYKLSECYHQGKCGVQIDISRANEYIENATQYGTPEINIRDIFL